jgi:hypothetical protein
MDSGTPKNNRWIFTTASTLNGSNGVDPDPVGSGTFWPGRIRILNNCSEFGSDLTFMTRKSFKCLNNLLQQSHYFFQLFRCPVLKGRIRGLDPDPRTTSKIGSGFLWKQIGLTLATFCT